MNKKSALLLLLATLTGLAKADDFLNIRTDPLMIIGGAYINLELDVRVSEHWSIGPYAQAATMEPLFDVGLRATHFESGAFQQGWMTGIELGLKQTADDGLSYDNDAGSFCKWDVDESVCGLSADKSLRLAVDHGFLWRWGTFNAGLGVGAEVNSRIDDMADLSLLPKLQFSIGWVR